MNLTELNDILGGLEKHFGRENVLAFAFALMDWMGIEKNQVPQLVAPKTQKLREYLVPAPTTAQSQLYRLSAEIASIRVRFAVLKRLRKDYISQLVDNDPGPESFQNTPELLRPITKAPYFIHFITVPEFNKLVLVFNQNDQKRIITFRKKLTNTQYNRIIQQWEGIGKKNKSEIACLFWKSLDIKEVNIEFYKQVKERFDALVGIVKAQRKKIDETQLRQFAVRFIGRYIFCWFLKEKGIIPEELISSMKIKNTDNYSQNVLIKLFFDTLNTKLEDRPPLQDEPLFEKIPYLNGGLFEETDADVFLRELDFDNWLIPFVKVLENYDFTVDESSSSYQQVAVDPEMLGRIFENLLASQNPETEKAANNERKAFGAFYTPRDIVDFMVEESLKTYLANKLNINADELSHAFTSTPSWPEKLNKLKTAADKALQEIKVLDPACGSGAFPMGVLHKLITLREIVGFYPNSYLLKKDILSNNIYGVDIMPMAVEIARLRAWLSLIVDEDYKPDKATGNFGIDSLPNLDFKFMQGNSLLETFEGVKIFDEKLLHHTSASRKKDLVEKTNKRISELQSKYFSLLKIDKLKGVEKATIEKELKEKKELLKKINKVEEPLVKYGLFSGEEHAGELAERLKKLHEELFKTSDKEQKKELKKQVEELEWNLIATSLRDVGKEDKLEELEKLRKQHIKPYFLYKLNFPEVFIEKNGFDVVIGNPPYVRQEAIDPYYKPKYIESHPEVGSGTADLYVYFFDSALYVANKGGIIIFITLNKYLKTKYGVGLRKKLKDRNVDLIIDFFELPVFEASTDTSITKIINDTDTDSTKYFPIKSLDNLNLNTSLKGKFLKVNKNSSEWTFTDNHSIKIENKFYSNSISLADFTGNKIWRGLTTGANEAFILNDEDADALINSESKLYIKKYLPSASFSKWRINSSSCHILYVPWDFKIDKYPSAKNHLLKFKDKLSKRPEVMEGRYNWYSMSRYGSQYASDFELPKIIYTHTAKKHEFYIDYERLYINNSTYMIICDNKYLFFFLNSILFDWFKRIKFVAYGDADEAGRVKLDYNKMITVPIKQIAEKQHKWFEKKYEEIKKNLAKADTVAKLEQEVEVRLFKLYELTYDEVMIVCEDFWMTEQEYENYKF